MNLSSIDNPIPTSGANFIANAIEEHWKLTTVFMYNLEYKGQTSDEVSHHYYFEVIIEYDQFDVVGKRSVSRRDYRHL